MGLKRFKRWKLFWVLVEAEDIDLSLLLINDERERRTWREPVIYILLVLGI